LRLIGGWREDRASGEAGLTAAGLLMFGQWTSIAEAFPLYFLDYQERPADAQSQTRWLDRIVPDGAWSGNLYDFFRRVIRKLTEDLKVPFVLQGGERVDDTPAHQALREALVNTLIHADYTGRASVLVVKQPSGFVFRNPGMMRVPALIALSGGESDCRNHTLHQMFLFINLGERAGSGLPKIRSGWEVQGQVLRLEDSFEPYEQTQLEMVWNPSYLGVSTETPLKTPEKILAAMSNKADITIPELAHLLEKSESAVKRAIRKLRDAGQIERIGADKGGRWEVRS
jgi:predicted HTH transcriptional regulator